MKIEKITENKIRFILNLDDLKEKNIDFHTFMSNSIESQSLFLDMLTVAEKEVGFVTKDYRLMIEALAMTNGNFILTVTRISPEKEKNKLKQKKLFAKRKLVSENNLISIYRFNNFDDFCSFCSFIDNNIIHILSKNKTTFKLYSYKSYYYLIITNKKKDILELKAFYSGISEFSNAIDNATIFERKLIEYGKLIIKNNAIISCNKFFNHSH